MYDNRSSLVAVGRNRKPTANSFLRVRATRCGRALLGVCAGGYLIVSALAIPDISKTTGNSYPAAPMRRELQFTVTGGSAYVYYGDTAFTTNALYGSNKPFITQTTSSGVVSASAPTKEFPWATSKVVFYRVGSTTAGQAHEIVLDGAGAKLVWSYQAGAANGYNSTQIFSPKTVTVDAVSGEYTVTSDEGTPVPTRGEALLLLNNTTGQTQNVQWGDKMLKLLPGVNQIRYDGAVDSNGLPATGPNDFAGTVITSPTGGTAIAANLVAGVEGVLSWGTPPATTAGTGEWVEVLTPPTSTRGGTVAIHYANGATGLVGVPAGSMQGSSSSTTGGAVLSDPTKPAPVQTTANTTNNTTNNSTTNTTTINNTYLGDTGDPQTEGFGDLNTDAMNQLTGDTGEDTVQASMDAFATRLESFNGAQVVMKDNVTGKFAAFSNILATQALPKNMVYSKSLVLPGFGSYELHIDFNTVPFPQVRAAFLVVITLGVAMAFMQRITI